MAAMTSSVRSVVECEDEYVQALHRTPQAFFEKRNGFLLAEACRLWVRPDDQVLDVTWGVGNWWTIYSPPHLNAHDKFTLDGVDCRDLPEETGSVDVVAFDPPYVSVGGTETSTVKGMHEAFGMQPGGFGATFGLIADGMAEAARVLREPRGARPGPKVEGGRLMVKCMDFVEAGRLRLGHHHVVSTGLALGLEQVDEFVHVSGPGPQPKRNRDGTIRRQVHSRRVHSYLVIFQKVRGRTAQI